MKGAILEKGEGVSASCGGRSRDGEAGARKEEGVCKMNMSCPRAAAGEVAWGKRLFAHLVGGMSPRKAGWWQSLVQPPMFGRECLLPLGSVLPLAPSYSFS